MPSRLAAAVLAGTALVAWPGQAAAKGVPTAVRACGPEACVTVTDRVVLVGVAHALERGAGAPARMAPYLRLTVRPAMFDLRGFVVPARGVLQVNGADRRLGRRAATVLRAEVAGIAPYRPKVAAVWVAGRRSPDPAAFAAILGQPRIAMPAAVWHSRAVLVAIDLAGDTPWSAWGSALYFPALRVLHSPDGAWVRVTAAQARALAPALVGARQGSRARVPFAPVAAAVIALLAAACLLGVRGLHRVQASRS